MGFHSSSHLGIFDEEEISAEVKLGIPDAYRRKVWLHITKISGKNTLEEYKNAVNKVFSGGEQQQDSILWETIYSYLPTGYNLQDHCLSEKGKNYTRNIFF